MSRSSTNVTDERSFIADESQDKKQIKNKLKKVLQNKIKFYFCTRFEKQRHELRREKQDREDHKHIETNQKLK